jgi:hypothetical protein
MNHSTKVEQGFARLQVVGGSFRGAQGLAVLTLRGKPAMVDTRQLAAALVRTPGRAGGCQLVSMYMPNDGAARSLSAERAGILKCPRARNTIFVGTMH